MSNPVSTTEYRLGREQELRIDVDIGGKIKLKLLDGLAEIFGATMAPRVEYTIASRKVAVFTWQGCVVQLIGKPQHAYVAEETPMMTYINLHVQLEKQRQRALSAGAAGPRVLVVGPTDVGKSTLCRILLNYCIRAQHQTQFVDLDVGQGAVTLPGSICAVPLERMVDIEQDFENTTPLAYFYGHTSPGMNPKLYNTIVGHLANLVNQRLEADRAANGAGIIINSCGWVEGFGYLSLVNAIQAFKVNVVVVLGDERLYSELTQQFQASPEITFLKLAKSGGVVVRDARYRRRARDTKIREYFYGSKDDLMPHRIVLNFGDFELYQIGQVHIAPTSALPIGEERKVDETRVIKIEPSQDMCYAILGLSFSDTAAGKALLEYNVAGFVFVDEVDMHRKRITVLAPAPGKLPKQLLMMGSLKWVES